MHVGQRRHSNPFKLLFPNVKTLYLLFPMEKVDYSYCDAMDIDLPEFFSAAFCSDTVIQLPSVTKVCLMIQDFQYDNYMFQCLFHLLPNLVSIETNRIGLIRKSIWHNPYNNFVTNALARLKLISIRDQYHQDTVANDIFTRLLFRLKISMFVFNFLFY